MEPSVVGVACLKLLRPNGIFPTTNVNTQKTVAGTKDYYNPVLKVKFKYPSDWVKTEYKEPTIIKVAFTKGKEAEFKFLIDDQIDEGMTLTTYTKLAMAAVTQIPGYKLVEQSDITLNGVQYHKVVYMNAVDGNQYKNLQVWNLKNGKSYAFSYTAFPETYDQYLPQAQAMLDTVEIW